MAEQNGDNFYFGLSSGETEIQGGLTVTKQAGYAVLFDLYGAASADAVIPDGTYELAQGTFRRRPIRVTPMRRGVWRTGLGKC